MIEQKSRPNKTKLKIDDVKISYKHDAPEQAAQKLKAAKSVPQVYYYGIEFPASQIVKLDVSCTKFMPLMYLCFQDVYGVMDDIGFPGDNAKITVVMPSNNDHLANIFMDFKVVDFKVENSRTRSNKKVHFWGICNVENLLISTYDSFQNSQSYEVCKSLAEKSGLGFSSNVSSSNDSQTWINPSMSRTDFIQDMTHRSWIGESSYVWTFVDHYYNLNYVDVESSLTEDTSGVKWITQSIYNTTINDSDNQNIKYSEPFLTNEMSMLTTNLYFKGQTILNQSTKISLNRGYIRNAQFYDIDGNWSSRAGKYSSYGIDTITTPGIESVGVILKGDPGSQEFYNMNSQNYWMGVIDTSNSFPDMLYAKLQNSENLKDLQKIVLQIVLPVPNFNIKRFEKVRLVFSNESVRIDTSLKNAKLNGQWLVVGISFNWDQRSMSQTVNLVKRELTIADL